MHPDAGTTGTTIAAGWYPHHGNFVNLLYVGGNVQSVDKHTLAIWCHQAYNGLKNALSHHLRIKGSN